MPFHHLSGISVRFQTLSHIQRQVAHALLTRPPLSCLNASRRINSNNSVRLECVRHAASVHPEPGSNSLNNCIKTDVSLHRIQSEFVLFLLFYFFVRVFFWYPSCPDIFHFMWFLKGIVEILCIIFSKLFSLYTSLILSRLLFNFQGPSPSLSVGDSFILPHLFRFVNPFFSFF